jgi:hypothetical protein
MCSASGEVSSSPAIDLRVQLYSSSRSERRGPDFRDISANISFADSFYIRFSTYRAYLSFTASKYYSRLICAEFAGVFLTYSMRKSR